MLKVNKINNYINPYDLYHSHNFYTQKQSDKKKKNYQKQNG